jgi:hypothetical protein
MTIVDQFLRELEQSARDMALELGREFLEAGGKVEDLPRLLEPIFALYAQHRAATLARVQAVIERHDGRPIH